MPQEGRRRYRFTHGEISSVRAQLDGSFDLEGAALHNPGKRVLALNSASIDGGIYADELTTDGEISAIGVQIEANSNSEIQH
ncbi:hypothetical protein [Rhodococcus globerulus]|uniref:Uncharacterized protein n=1 Tax=Rhodococcus globerulus TaxID=33008 RepID=A0ABU4BYR6_RHOGO|nr:hypothetical protein [Rhodococcus globerulus]MDV6269313.1 hypothetical protein [Rhodococcus globerulus]